MRIIIGGAGRVGLELARALRKESKDVVLVDVDARAVKTAQGIDVLVIQGDITDRSKFIEAGIEDAQIFVAATDSDERNILACTLAKYVHEMEATSKHGPITTICRLHDPRLVSEGNLGHLHEWTGVDYIVNPIAGAIERLLTGLRSSSFEEVIPFGSGTHILELDIDKDATFVGKTLREAGKLTEGKLPLIVGLKRNKIPGKVPNADDFLMEGDRIAVATSNQEEFDSILEIFGHKITPYPDHPKVLIFGATQAGIEISSNFLATGSSVTIIERELQAANDLAGTDLASNPRFEIIHGDHLDKSLLSEVEIESHDIAIAAFSNDNESIAATLLASDLGVLRTGLILHSSDLVNVVRRMGITFAVDRNRIAVDGFLSRIHTKLPGSYAVLSSIQDVVGFRFHVSEKSGLHGKNIASTNLPDWCKIGFIHREDESRRYSVPPSPSTNLELNDWLTIFLPPDKVEDFEKKYKV